jgi:hypothetical protein
MTSPESVTWPLTAATWTALNRIFQRRRLRARLSSSLSEGARLKDFLHRKSSDFATTDGSMTICGECLSRSDLSAKHIFETKLGKIASNAPPIRATRNLDRNGNRSRIRYHSSQQARNRLQNLTFDRVADGSDII